jgi:type III restriction enzyme
LIEKNGSEVEVLIFKEAVAVGWDCPRAQVLVMLRAIRSLTFEIQTVGRILRMPEAKHYDIAELNKAFVYSKYRWYQHQ